MSINIMILVLLLILSLFQYSNAANHFVGGPDGSWDMVTDFESWSSSKKFFIGDTLTFQYMAGVHNVFEVTESDYDTCTGTNPIMKDSSGSTVVKLVSSGKRYFICEIPGHCVSGMKVSVNVLTSSSDKSSAPPPIAHDDSSPTPIASTSPPPTETNLPPPLPSTPPPSTTSSPPPSISPVSSVLPPSSSPPSSSPPSSSSPESSSPSPASSMAPEPSTSPSPASSMAPEPSTSPPSPSTMPSESPSTTSPTGSTTDDQPSLASKTSCSFQYVIGLILGFTILFHVC